MANTNLSKEFKKAEEHLDLTMNQKEQLLTNSFEARFTNLI